MPKSTAEVMPELDRQLGEQRAAAEAMASRAGLMVGVTGVLLTVAATLSATVPADSKFAYWLVGAGTVLGIAVFAMARLGLGPTAVELERSGDKEIRKAKILLVEANSRAIARVEGVFFLQIVVTILGVIALLASMGAVP